MDTKEDNGKFPIQVKILAISIIICWIMAFYDSVTSETYSYCKSGHWMGKMYHCDTTATIDKRTGKIIKLEIH